MSESKVNKISIDGSNQVVVNDINNSSITINTTDIEQLRQMFIELQAWQHGTFTNTLNIFVLSTSRNQLENLYHNFIEFQIPFSNYGQNPKDWQPFQQQLSIIEILAEFHTVSGFKLNAYFIDNWLPEDEEMLAMLKDDIIPHTILIADSLALDIETNREFARLFDDSEIGGFIAPISAEYNDNVQFYMKQRQQQIFKHLTTCFFRRFNREYQYIEPNVTSKEELFRRLTDIAIKHLDIRPLSKVQWQDKILKSKGFDGMSNLKSSF